MTIVTLMTHTVEAAEQRKAGQTRQGYSRRPRKKREAQRKHRLAKP
jgi:hypothetical protein